MKALTDFIQNRLTLALIGVLLPLIVAGHTWMAKFLPDAASKIVDAQVADVVASSVVGGVLILIGHLFKKNRDGVREIQKTVNDSPSNAETKVDGQAGPKTIAAVKMATGVSVFPIQSGPNGGKR